jgi:hypothetical protein
MLAAYACAGILGANRKQIAFDGSGHANRRDKAQRRVKGFGSANIAAKPASPLLRLVPCRIGAETIAGDAPNRARRGGSAHSQIDGDIRPQTHERNRTCD